MPSPAAPAFARLLLVGLLASAAPAQETLDAPLRARTVRFAHDTGPVANPAAAAAVVIAFPATVPGAPWLRLRFDEVRLAPGARLRMTSLRDAAVQELDARGVEQWQRTSAYFNGDAVLVEVLAPAGAGASRLVLESASAGLPTGGDDAGCGVDTRVPSSDGRGARLVPPGCTAWLFSDCSSCLLSAGHCVAQGMVAQFNVPPSLGDGTLVHPPVEDQFPVDPASVQSQNQGPGFDWAYFGCFPNNLGQTAFQRQLARWDAGGGPVFDSQDVIRVTGNGVAGGTLNQVQQTVTGTWNWVALNYTTYSTFVLPGNSGSPAIHEETGIALGIVTHLGCAGPTLQNNIATRFTQPALQAALASPLGVCAATPCEGVGLGYCPTGPRMSVISGEGSASIAANDLVLHANNVPPNKLGVFLYARNAQLVPFGASSLCIGGAGFPVRRLPTVNSGAGTTLTFALDQQALPGGDQFLAGEEICFQAWFRVSTSANETSNGLKVTFAP